MVFLSLIFIMNNKKRGGETEKRRWEKRRKGEGAIRRRWIKVAAGYGNFI
jgi:hypothetical protein